jgi:hypothetical protein
MELEKTNLELQILDFIILECLLASYLTGALTYDFFAFGITRQSSGHRTAMIRANVLYQ